MTTPRPSDDAPHDEDTPVTTTAPSPTVEPPMPRRFDVATVAARLGDEHALARALRAVDEDPEKADRLAAEALEASRDEVRATQAAARWSRYAQTRPARFADAGYARLKPQQSADGRVTGWWSHGGQTLVLASLPGRGKTDAGYAVCNEVAGADRHAGRGTAPVVVRAVSWAEFTARQRPPGAHAARDEHVAADRERALLEAQTCDLLLIDDLTAAKGSEASLDLLYRVLDARTSTPGKRTIVTLNAPEKKELGAVLKQLGGHIVSRLRQGATVSWIEGDDLRQWENWDPFGDDQG